MKRVLVALLALILAVACASNGGERAPGHTGPVPSALAQHTIRQLRGQSFSDATGTLGPGQWEVSSFGVIPNDVSPGGKGPIVRVANGPTTKSVPVETDGDVADLYFRVTGRTARDLTGPLSETYTRFWKKK